MMKLKLITTKVTALEYRSNIGSNGAHSLWKQNDIREQFQKGSICGL